MSDTHGGAPRPFEVIEGGRELTPVGGVREDPRLTEAFAASDQVAAILEMFEAQEAERTTHRVVSTNGIVAGAGTNTGRPLEGMTVANQNPAPEPEAESTEEPDGTIPTLHADAIQREEDGFYYVKFDTPPDPDFAFLRNLPDGSQLVAQLRDDGRIVWGSIRNPDGTLGKRWEDGKLIYDRQTADDGVHRIHAS